MKSGFIINRLICKGNDLEEVYIDFDPNAHVIVGLSNRGKSYIFQCIKYMLGSQEKPKRITESEGYQYCFLEITLFNGESKTLCRSLDGGDAQLYECKYSEIVSFSESPITLRVGKKATKTVGLLNDYLLDVVNLKNKKVRRNLSGNTDKFSFSFMRHLTLIDETSIIKESSPILTEQRGEETKEKSIIRFLTTGKDDSGIISRPKKEVILNRRGRIELIEQLIDDYTSELDSYSYSSQDNKELNEQIDKIESSINELNNKLYQQYDRVKEYELAIDGHFKDLKENESRLVIIDELLSRSKLLSQHYENDIDRLESIYETNILFSELQLVNCPACRKVLDTSEHLECDAEDISRINTASVIEIEKINNLITELDVTQSNLELERYELLVKIKNNRDGYLEKQEQVSQYTSCDIKDNIDKLDVFKNKLNNLKQISHIFEKIDSLIYQKSNYKKEIDPLNGNYDFDDLTTANMTELCETIKVLLNDWNYSDVDSVSFSELECDLVINGENRQLAGKGYRALSYSAFIIGLMQFCIKNNRGHSGIVLLDSPLCTLRSKYVINTNNIDKKDIIMDSTKEKFYSAISQYKGLGQIIILENDAPAEPSSLELGFTEFTEDKNLGRYGFYPVS
ncbi:coiled-coil domain-containing protein [Photobacterium leiognathi]|uniref:coiled-coil domain-containing protein n=1 Tax=Photobacterium leiognathi TaxID=553611 RepID=UPI0027383B3C|nr:AAA family ATPase [Photobacterium leiognathi]